jgi:hypothetical protein
MVRSFLSKESSPARTKNYPRLGLSPLLESSPQLEDPLDSTTSSKSSKNRLSANKPRKGSGKPNNVTNAKVRVSN